VSTPAGEPTILRSAPHEPLDSELWIAPLEFLYRRDRKYEPLLTERWVCAVWSGHPEVSDRISSAQYLSLPHVALGLPPDQGASDSLHLQRLGVTRTIQATVPNFLVLPLVLRGTRLVATLPQTVAQLLSRTVDIRILAMPFDMPAIELAMQWPRRYDNDPGHLWFREMVVKCAAEVETNLSPPVVRR
jgi:LysR family nod box-dependent transcriptional activator